MGIFHEKHTRPGGFTVVEIIITVSVIAILAAIVTVAYPQYMRTARDNERKSDLAQLASAIKGWALQKNNYMEANSGCGLFNEGNGWVNHNATTSGGWYGKSIAECLEEAGLLKDADEMKDPSGCISDYGPGCGTGKSDGSTTNSPTTAYMKAVCTKNGKKAVYFVARLETQPRKDAEVDAICDPNSLPWFSTVSQKWGTNYGLNYYIRVE